jgi:integrase
MAKPIRPWYRAGKQTWYLTIDSRKVSLGVRGRENKAAALEAWHKIMATVPTVHRGQRQEAITGEVIRGFLADVAGRAGAKCLRVYRYFLLPFAKKYGSLPAAELTAPLAESYGRKPGWSGTTRHQFLGALVTAFRWAERARLVERNPVAGVRKPPKASRGAGALITTDQHSRLLAAASPYYRPFLLVLFGTGARPGEVARITAENFDEEAGVVRLAEHKTQHVTGRGRVIYLRPEVVDLLARQRQRYPSGPLLRTLHGRPWTGQAVVRAMINTRERAALDHATAYSYRHSFATDALAGGVPEAVVAALLGHSGTATLHKHYAHLEAKTAALRAAAARVRDGQSDPHV